MMATWEDVEPLVSEAMARQVHRYYAWLWFGEDANLWPDPPDAPALDDTAVDGGMPSPGGVDC